jgi:hypothetical protein
MKQILEKIGLSNDSPQAIAMKLSDKVESRDVESYMLSEIVKTQKHANDLHDVVEDRFAKIENMMLQLSDAIKTKTVEVEKTKLADGKQVTLTLHANTIKTSALMAVGATVERPVSNALNGIYSPISSGTYGLLIGLVGMGLTYKKQGSYSQWLAQGYFIGGFSQMIQDIFGFVSTNLNLPAGL